MKKCENWSIFSEEYEYESLLFGATMWRKPVFTTASASSSDVGVSSESDEKPTVNSN